MDCVYQNKFKKYKLSKPKKLTLITVARYAEKKGFDFVEKIGEHLTSKIEFEWIIIGRNVSELKKWIYI